MAKGSSDFRSSNRKLERHYRELPAAETMTAAALQDELNNFQAYDLYTQPGRGKDGRLESSVTRAKAARERLNNIGYELMKKTLETKKNLPDFKTETGKNGSKFFSYKTKDGHEVRLSGNTFGHTETESEYLKRIGGRYNGKTVHDASYKGNTSKAYDSATKALSQALSFIKKHGG